MGFWLGKLYVLITTAVASYVINKAVTVQWLNSSWLLRLSHDCTIKLVIRFLFRMCENGVLLTCNILFSNCTLNYMSTYSSRITTCCRSHLLFIPGLHMFLYIQECTYTHTCTLTSTETLIFVSVIIEEIPSHEKLYVGGNVKKVCLALLKLWLRIGGDGIAIVISCCLCFGERTCFTSIHPGHRYPWVENGTFWREPHLVTFTRSYS